MDNLYNAAEASTPASLGLVTPQFKLLPGGGYDYSNPLVHPETLVDVELGGGYKGEKVHATLNLFYMSFKDEIIANGQLDRFGIPVTGNAERTLHQGIEASGSAHVLDGLEVSANATLSKNRLVRVHGVPITLSRSRSTGTRLRGFRISWRTFERRIEPRD